MADIFDIAIAKTLAGGGGGGGADNVLITNCVLDNATVRLDKTWQEIHDAFINGKGVIMINVLNEQEDGSIFQHLVEHIGIEDGLYYAEFSGGVNSMATDSPNGYPAEI